MKAVQNYEGKKLLKITAAQTKITNDLRLTEVEIQDRKINIRKQFRNTNLLSLKKKSIL